MAIELSDIIRENIHKLNLTPYQSHVLHQIMDCRTKRFGAHVNKCTNSECNHKEISYNSCRSRYCPKCQGSKQIEWKSKTLDDLLPVNYSHIIFPIPNKLLDLFQYNNKECYEIQFKAVNKTLNELSNKSKKLKGNIGLIGILHTWTNQLNYYPHIHCLIPEGGINNEKTKWISCNSKSVFRKEDVETRYKINLINYLNKAFKKGNEELPKTDDIKCKIYIRSSFKEASGVINYLGNNINKTAITNQRIKKYENNKVTFTYKDRADGNKEKEIEIDAVVFLKRFILHILPKRFTRIRYYGYLANNCRKLNIEICKRIIKIDEDVITKNDDMVIRTIKVFIDKIKRGRKCPCCRKGFLKPEKVPTAR